MGLALNARYKPCALCRHAPSMCWMGRPLPSWLLSVSEHYSEDCSIGDRCDPILFCTAVQASPCECAAFRIIHAPSSLVTSVVFVAPSSRPWRPKAKHGRLRYIAAAARFAQAGKGRGSTWARATNFIWAHESFAVPTWHSRCRLVRFRLRRDPHARS